MDGLETVELLTTSEDWQLMIPNGVIRADVFLRNESDINVKGAGGSIRILAQNIDISGSQLRIEIPSDSRLPDTRAGDLDLNATGSITISDSVLANSLFGEGTIGNINLTAGNTISLDNSSVYDTLENTGIGKIGDINVTAGSLSLTEVSQLVSFTAGQGNAGSVTINARDSVSLDDSVIFNTVRATGIGNAGDINITTGALSLTNIALLRSFTLGQGNSSSVTINARDSVIFTDSVLFTNTYAQGDVGNVTINAGNTITLDNTAVAAFVSEGGIGNAGAINVTAGSLLVIGGSQLLSFTSGRGNAGSVTINARDRVSLDGVDPYGEFVSAISTEIDPEAVGQGGDVTIRTGSLFLTNGGSVYTDNLGGVGNSGRVTIQARNSVQIRGGAPTQTGFFPSGVFTSVEPESVGDGGDVSITTGSLSVANQGRITTAAQGQGNAGRIQIQASDRVSFDGGDAISTLSEGGVGRGGDIDITARSLSVLNNAQLSASTSGDGDAGNITVSADTVGLSNGGQLLTTTFSNGQAGDITVNTPDLQLSGATSGLFAQTTTAANAGNLTIQPRGNGQSVRVNLQDGAQISASTSSRGRGGTLTITAPGSITLTGNGSIIAAETEGRGRGGNLRLTTGDLNIQNQAEVTVSSSGAGSAGSLFVNADRIFLSNGGRIRADSVGSGRGGNLTLQTGTLNIQDQAEVTVSSSGTGQAGNLFVDADRIFLDNRGRIRADTSGEGGNINLRSPLILLRNGSNISTNARGENIPGGNIAIDTQFLIAVPTEDSNISANSQDFRGGNVNINAIALYGIQPSLNPTPLSDITATGATSALPGTIDVTTAGVDPTAGLVALPSDLVDSSGLIARGCPATQGNSFVITGRGGLPPTPEQRLDDDADWQDHRRLTVAQQTSPSTSLPTSAISPPAPDASMSEATGWQVTPTGEVTLVATTPTSTVQNPLNRPLACPGVQ